VGFVLAYFDGSQTRVIGYGCGGLLVVLVFLNALTTQLIYFQSLELGMKVRVALTDLIYAKSLRLSLGRATVGQITNLISNDGNRFDRHMYPLVYLFVAPAQFCFILAVLWIYMGPSVVLGLAWIIAIIPIQRKKSQLFYCSFSFRRTFYFFPGK